MYVRSSAKLLKSVHDPSKVDRPVRLKDKCEVFQCTRYIIVPAKLFYINIIILLTHSARGRDIVVTRCARARLKQSDGQGSPRVPGHPGRPDLRTGGPVEVDEFGDKDGSADGPPAKEEQERHYHVLHGEHAVRLLRMVEVGIRRELIRVHEPVVDDTALHERGDDAIDGGHERHVTADQVHEVERPRTRVHDVQHYFVVAHVGARDDRHQIVFPSHRDRRLTGVSRAWSYGNK